MEWFLKWYDNQVMFRFSLICVMLFACLVHAGDDYEILEILKKRGEQGNVEAQLILGHMYDEGIVVPENNAEAVRWYAKAAEQGLAEAQLILGHMYDEGLGVPEDNAEAVRW